MNYYVPGNGFFLSDNDLYQIWSSDSNDLELRIRGSNGEFIPVARFSGDLEDSANHDFLMHIRGIEGWFLRHPVNGDSGKELWGKIKEECNLSSIYDV